MRLRILLLALAALAGPLHAAPLLPAAIDACLAAGNCTAPEQVAVSPGLEVYGYAEAGTPRFLLRYALGPGAAENGTPLAGSLWVGVAAQYERAAAPHAVQLYFDRVAPRPRNLWVGDSDGLDVTLVLPDSALLGGAAHYLMQDRGATEIGMGTLGDGFAMLMGGLPVSFLPCVADGCEAEAAFHMVGYRYTAAGGTAAFEFVPGGSGPVYFQRRAYPPDPAFEVIQTYSAVPLPAALPLCLAGLAFLGRRR